MTDVGASLTDVAKVAIPAAFVYLATRQSNKNSKTAAEQSTALQQQTGASTADLGQRAADLAAFNGYTAKLEGRVTQLEADLKVEREGRIAAEERAVRAERAAEECNLRVTKLERRLPPT